MQNNLACVVCKSPYNTNVTELLRELHLLPVRHRIIYKLATITYRTQNCQQPSYLLDSLVSYQPARTPRSSSSNLLIVPNRVKTVTASRAFHVAAPTIWNNLHDFVKATDSFNVFERLLKCHLFDTAFLTTIIFQIGVSVSRPHKQQITAP
jgi:hypothetical protein